MIPEFNTLGLLPPGVHACTLDEAESRFSWTNHRQRLIENLKHFVLNEFSSIKHPASLLVDGSFVRSKAEPEDIDLVIDLDESVTDEEAILTAFRYQIIERPRLKEVYNLDVWVRHPAIPDDLSAFFQYAGDKAAAELKISSQHPKGILRIKP